MIISNTYNDAYKRHLQYFLPQSLFQLVSRSCEHYLRNLASKPKFLEIGCGNGSVFEDIELCGNYIAIDISENAISNAINRQSNDRIKFLKLNALEVEYIDEKFDLILDSHLLHCLEDLDEVNAYLQSIYKSLESNGVLIIETMVCNSSFIKSYVGICEEYGGLFIGDFPNVGKRIVFTQLFLERLVVDTGFKIEFLKFPIGSKFIFDNKREEAFDSDPDVIQLILRKGEKN